MPPALPDLSRFARLSIADAWTATSRLPLGNRLFSKLIGLRIPYSGTIAPLVLELGDGHAKVEMRDRRAVRNHLDCVHAIALMNLGELTTGLAVFHALDGKVKGIVTALRIEYAKKARGTITASCDVTIPEITGKQDLQVEGVLRNAKGDEVARVWATWQLKP